MTIDDLFREQTEESVQETTAEEPSATEKEEEEKAEEKKPDRMTLEISGEDKDARKMLKDLGVRLEPEINSLNQAADELLQNLFDSKHEPVTLPDLSEERPVSDGPAEGLPWEDDGIYRAVLFKGRMLVCTSPEGKGTVGSSNMDLDQSILSCFSVSCGDVDGNVSAAGNVSCGDVGGNASASGNLSCGDIEGDAAASGNLNCGDVCGNVSAEGNITCQSVEGKVSAGGDIKIG